MRDHRLATVATRYLVRVKDEPRFLKSRSSFRNDLVQMPPATNKYSLRTAAPGSGTAFVAASDEVVELIGRAIQNKDGPPPWMPKASNDIADAIRSRRPAGLSQGPQDQARGLSLTG